MRIGIDCFPLAGGAGISRYVKGIVGALLQSDQNNEYVLYGPSFGEFAQGPQNIAGRANVTTRTLKGVWARSATIWMQAAARNILVDDAIDVFWGTQTIIPLNLPPSIRVVSTVYDLAWKLYPETVQWTTSVLFPMLFKRSLSRADTIVCISHSTVRDLEALLPSVADRVAVVYPGVWSFAGKDESPWAPGVKSDYPSLRSGKTRNRGAFSEEALPPDYLLTVSTVEPRKNITALLEAYSHLKRNYGFKPPLVVAGKRGWGMRRMYSLARKLNLTGRDVIFTGYVSDHGLACLYRRAALFVTVSLYEGFGFPSLEAMAAGLPVVASDIPVFREVLGEAAVLTDPSSPERIARCIHDLVSDPDRRAGLAEAGKARAKMFSWWSAANRMADILG